MDRKIFFIRKNKMVASVQNALHQKIQQIKKYLPLYLSQNPIYYLPDQNSL